jgi:sulfur-carrier protein
MRVTIRFFASQREATGLSTYVADVPDDARAADILVSLYDLFPKLKTAATSVAFALNREHVKPNARLHEGDELALLPPLAGG